MFWKYSKYVHLMAPAILDTFKSSHVLIQGDANYYANLWL